MPEAKQLLSNYEILLDKLGFNQLSVTTTHALRAGQLQIEHRDPFDRMLMAQAELESIPIITYDKAFHRDFIDVIPGVG
jgi:PIN domain nuclease of toxin-antitoxin system